MLNDLLFHEKNFLIAPNWMLKSWTFPKFEYIVWIGLDIKQAADGFGHRFRPLAQDGVMSGLVVHIAEARRIALIGESPAEPKLG